MWSDLSDRGIEMKIETLPTYYNQYMPSLPEYITATVIYNIWRNYENISNSFSREE